MAESATIRLDLPAASTAEVITAILEALSTIERDRLGKGARRPSAAYRASSTALSCGSCSRRWP
jgi:hypothetical protein